MKKRKIGMFLRNIVVIRFTFWDKLLIFWRLLKTKEIEEGYTFEEMFKDEF